MLTWLGYIDGIHVSIYSIHDIHGSYGNSAMTSGRLSAGVTLSTTRSRRISCDAPGERGGCDAQYLDALSKRTIDNVVNTTMSKIEGSEISGMFTSSQQIRKLEDYHHRLFHTLLCHIQYCHTHTHNIFTHTHTIFTHNWSNTTNTYKYNIVTYSYVIHAHTTQSDNTLSHTTSHATQQTNLRHMQLCHTQDCHIQLSGWWFGTWILFFHILGIILPTDFHIFQRGRLNHQPAVLMYPWQAWHLVKGCLTRTPADIDTLHWGFWHIRSFPYVPYIIPHFSIILTELPMYCWLYLIVHAMSAVSPLARIEKSDEDAWIQELLRHPEWRPDQGAGKFPIMFFLLGKPRRLGLMVPQAMFAGIFIVSLWSKSNRDHPEPTG